ncbi:hypothetical protein TSOC_007427 [Tetrabaena socialis]|uniref:Uncharacterized protein n=1 Tax=Tetrabaena socialis TaxID=47790 RepID=A0A2J8A137_9CHLO|nr:hypothetical protein TSOC_007426 [Tetrabaena socialis]PNH06242.1 hypothetical protein TSOC_007427 [Tetrabaena socialis]|eukprot:PNH06241.1 hypothetical protein TSOC_007426 [Tetrabaena socialis]
MACAMVMSPCAIAPHKFKGDAPDLVDLLVAVCRVQAASPTSKLCQRELTPFSFEDAPPLPKAAKSPPKGRSPRCSPPKGKADNARKMVASRGSMDGTSNALTAPKQPLSSARFGSLDDDLVRVLRGHAPTPVKACPGFFSSPRPCDLPMPTMLLLGKAAPVKA